MFRVQTLQTDKQRDRAFGNIAFGTSVSRILHGCDVLCLRQCSLCEAIQPFFFGCAQNGRFLGFDLYQLASVRLTLQGTRQIVITRFTDIGQYVRSLGPASDLGKPISSLAAKQWLSTATSQDIHKFSEQGTKSKIWFGTLAENDVCLVLAC